MKANEIITEDLSRRGFLKGITAAAGLGTVGSTMAGSSDDLKQQARELLKKQGIKPDPEPSENTIEKEIQRTKQIFSRLKELDRRINHYDYDSKSRTLVLYGAWPKGPGYDGNNVARGWAIEFDPRIVQFVQLWSLDGKVKFGSTMNNNKNRF